jgi:hypothetical protein
MARQDTMAWKCPICRAIVQYEDYDRALKGHPYICRVCGEMLKIDRKRDRPVLAHEPAVSDIDRQAS